MESQEARGGEALELRYNDNRDRSNGRYTFGPGGGKTKYLPSSRMSHKGITIGTKEYARLCGELNTRYPNAKPEDGPVTIRDARYSYQVTPDGYGGMTINRRENRLTDRGRYDET